MKFRFKITPVCLICVLFLAPLPYASDQKSPDTLGDTAFSRRTPFRYVTAVDWHPTKSVIAVAFDTDISPISRNDESLSLYTTSGIPIVEIPLLGPERNIIELQWSPDGSKLAVYMNDLTGRPDIIHIWNTETITDPIRLESFPERHEAASDMAWSPDSRYIATNWEGRVRIWDTVSGTIDTEWDADSTFSQISELAWNKDGTRLTGGNGEKIFIWDMTSADKPILFETTHLPSSYFDLVWDPEGQQIAYSDPINIYIYRWNTSNGNYENVISLSGHNNRIPYLAWSANKLVSAGVDNIINVWNTSTWQIVSTLTTMGAGLRGHAIALSPDGTQLVFDGATGNLQITQLDENTLGNRIWLDANGNGIQDAGETGMPGLTVHLLNNNFGIVKTVQTNAYGFYTFADLVPGTHYYIEIIPPTDTHTIAPLDRGADDTRDSDFDWRDNFGTPDPTDRVLRSMRFTASAGMQRDDLDAGFMPNSDLRVRVWRDTDGDGVQDTGEQGMAGVSLFLRRANFTRYRDPLTTDSDGFATFTNLPAGDYYVQITVPSGYSLAPFNIGPDDNIDNDFAMAFDYETGSGNVPRTLRFTLAPGLIREDIDAGLKQP